MEKKCRRGEEGEEKRKTENLKWLHRKEEILLGMPVLVIFLSSVLISHVKEYNGLEISGEKDERKTGNLMVVLCCGRRREWTLWRYLIVKFFIIQAD